MLMWLMNIDFAGGDGLVEEDTRMYSSSNTMARLRKGVGSPKLSRRGRHWL